MIGHDANGEETPLHTVWSLSTLSEEELKDSPNSDNTQDDEAEASEEK